MDMSNHPLNMYMYMYIHVSIVIHVHNYIDDHNIRTAMF